jgi:hypothetical protein
MPLQIFIVLVFGICCWLAIAVIEPLMRSFAVEAGMASWLFIAIPGLLAMLFSLFAYRGATRHVNSLENSVSRALLVALLTWIAVASLIAWLWCPWHSALACYSNALMTSGIVGGGPLLAGTLVASGIVFLVVRKRPTWLTFGNEAKPVAKDTAVASGPIDAR